MTVSLRDGGWAATHEDRSLFEEMMVRGVPRHQWCSTLAGERCFALWLAHALGSREAAISKLSEIARIGVTDARVLRDRLAFARYVVGSMRFEPSGDGLCSISAEDSDRIDAAIAVVAEARSRVNLCKARLVAEYIMRAARHGASGGASVGEIAHLIGASKPSAKAYVDLFCEYQRGAHFNNPVAPLFRMRREATAFTSRRWEVVEERR